MSAFHLFLPQMRLSIEALVERATAAESAGFEGIALMDHLHPPLAEAQPMYEAITTAAWIGAHTTTLKVGHLVLCDSFRHPAVLARQAVTLDHATGGRFELGIGWGSVPEEMAVFGLGDPEARQRVARLDETLAVINGLWSGEPTTHHGEFFDLDAAQQQPTPRQPIPIVIGGAGPKTLALVAKHADWWNCPIYALDRFDKLRTKVGSAKPSIQQMVAFVPSEPHRTQVTQTAQRRFGGMGDGLTIGSASELVEHFGAVADRGVERFYVWMADFADPENLAQFGAEVITPLR